MFIGTGLFSFYELGSTPLPEGMKPDAIFPFFILSELPIGVTGLIISALTAAAISSLDSDINCLSAVGVEDFYARFKKNVTDKQKLRFGKYMVVAAGLGALIVASIYVKMEGKGILV